LTIPAPSKSDFTAILDNSSLALTWKQGTSVEVLTGFYRSDRGKNYRSTACRSAMPATCERGAGCPGGTAAQVAECLEASAVRDVQALHPARSLGLLANDVFRQAADPDRDVDVIDGPALTGPGLEELPHDRLPFSLLLLRHWR